MKGPIWLIVKQAYAIILRPLLLKAIDDPNVEWDDYVLKVLDSIFDYGKES